MKPAPPLVVWASPAARVLLLIGLVSLIATSPLGNLSAGAACGVITLCTVILARPTAKAATRGLIATITIVMLLLPYAWVGRTDEAWALLCRAAFAATTAIAIGSTLSVNTLSPALGALGVPPAFGAVIATMARQLTSIRAEAERLALARRLRGASSVWTDTDTLATLVVRSARRSERVELAMRLRGYTAAAAASDARLGLRDVPLLSLAFAAGAATHVL